MMRLGEAEIERELAARPGWRLADEEDSSSIVREWEMADFAAALAFVNRIGWAAQEADHHPDILLHGWNKVRLTLSTHSKGGLTGADFRLAGRIDELA
jgi:4a-hydroxytetrahydrobiopterin dehydratase